MKYKISADIASSKKLSPMNLQEVKVMVEETIIENLRTPEGTTIYINMKVTKESG